MKHNRRWYPNRPLSFRSPTTIGTLISTILLFLAMALMTMHHFVGALSYSIGDFVYCISMLFFLFFFIMIILTIKEKQTRTVADDILLSVGQRLLRKEYGNPLHLNEGDIIPNISIRTNFKVGYIIRITCRSVSLETISNMDAVISDSLLGKYSHYAVVKKKEDIAGCYVDFFIEDICKKYNSQRIITEPSQFRPLNPYQLIVRDNFLIDYTKIQNGSAIVAGKTRSGKTTAIIGTFLLPILTSGSDNYNSSIVIIDPKNAELSQCFSVLSPSLDGNAEHILAAIEEFNSIRIKRQQELNKISKESGRPVSWYEAGMHPCILFIDEFVALDGLFPKKPSKENPNYCIDRYKALIRSISTQGASAGCFLILSTAEASVGAGGLEAIVNHACGIRILFKPTFAEASFLWDASKLENMPDYDYSVGDAWITMDDGEHNDVEIVKFPRLDIGEYKLLDDYLKSYYSH